MALCSVLRGGLSISAFSCLCYFIMGLPNFIVYGRGTYFCLLVPLFHHLSHDPSSVLTGGVTISAFFFNMLFHYRYASNSLLAGGVTIYACFEIFYISIDMPQLNC